jgi:hypothetical protein
MTLIWEALHRGSSKRSLKGRKAFYDMTGKITRRIRLTAWGKGRKATNYASFLLTKVLGIWHMVVGCVRPFSRVLRWV